MADLQRLGKNFDRGFQSDIARDQLPAGAAYRMRDFIPQLGAPVRKRGGYGAASGNLGTLSTAARIPGLGWAPFADDPHLVAISEGGKVYQIKTFTTAGGSYLGTTNGHSPTHRPFWHRDRVIIPAGLAQAAANPYKLYATAPGTYALAAVGGTPPQARGGFSWGDYLVLFNYYEGGVLKNYRMAFSGVGNPDSWTYSGVNSSHFDVDEEMLAGVPLRNVILSFGYSQTWIITGDTPPPGGNLAKRTLFNYGTFDGRSVTKYREYAIWANAAGVWRTDGATLTDLTELGGISQYYRSLVSGFSSTWVAAGGIDRGHYFLSLTDNNGAHVTTLVCDLDRQIWFETDNIQAAMYAERSSGPGTVTATGHEELFFGHRLTPNTGKMSDIWTPTSANSADADGAAVLPELETPFYKLDLASDKRIRKAYLSYDLRGAGSAPVLVMSAVFSPEVTDYTQLLPVMPVTSEMQRRDVFVNRRVKGVGFKISQQSPSADTRLYDIELEGHAVERSK